MNPYLPGTYFLFIYTLTFPVLVVQLSLAHFMNQSSHPLEDANSMFSFKAISSAFCLDSVS
jgi:hypothetical protein